MNLNEKNCIFICTNLCLKLNILFKYDYRQNDHRIDSTCDFVTEKITVVSISHYGHCKYSETSFVLIIMLK